jgi:hypothetical protein
MIRKFINVFCLYLFFSSYVIATPIVFDLRSSLIESIDEQATFELVNNDIIATLTTNVGVLNRTSSGFGVNATGTGDATSLIDNGSGVSEFIQIQFNKTVNLLDLTVSSFGSGDSGLLSIDALSIFEINKSGLNSLNNLIINDGALLTLSFIGGNGFSFDSFTVSEISVTEPGGSILLLSGLVLLFVRKYWKLKYTPEDNFKFNTQ